MKKIFIVVGLAVLLSPLSAAAKYGEDATAETEVESEVKTRPLPIRPAGALMERKIEFQDRASTTKADIKGNLMEKRDDFKEKASTTRAEVRANVETRKVELRAEFKTRLATRVGEFLNKIVEHFNNAIDRIESIKEKIQSRIDKLSENGIDTTEAEAKLEIAGGLIADANVSVDALASLTISEEDPQSSVESIKAAIQDTREAIRKAHQALIDVINSLKPGINARVEVEAGAEVQ